MFTLNNTSTSTFAKHTSTTTGTAISYVIRPAEVETWKDTITKPIPLLIRIGERAPEHGYFYNFLQ